MNYMQFVLFFIFVGSALIAGARIQALLNKEPKITGNRWFYLGETLLLGGIIVVGELLLIALAHAYRAPYLWGAVAINYLCLLHLATRAKLKELFLGVRPNLPGAVLSLLIAFFVFRNCYFLIDIDSQGAYLFTQRLWLEAGTCFVGNNANDVRIFVPHFDAVPYSLGISLFGQDTLFPQLINVFWRVIALFLVFGYTSQKTNGYCGLAAVAIMVFNDHFFISGANNSVVINGALVACIFACVCNFWEAKDGELKRLFLALIFLVVLLANKYQMVYIVLFLFIWGLLFQKQLLHSLGLIFSKSSWVSLFIFVVGTASIFYIRNFIVTGDPIFPIFAGRLKAFGWTLEQDKVFLTIFGGVTPLIFIKYLNFFFIWPGMMAAKYVVMTLSFLPLIFAIAYRRNRFNKEEFLKLCFWLSACVLLIMGTSLSNHQDPRYYRFALGALAFTAVLSLHYILSNCFVVRRELVTASVIVFMSLPGFTVMFKTPFGFPTMQDNIAVLRNKLHMEDIIKKDFPHIMFFRDAIALNPEKAAKAAYAVGEGGNFHSFLLPTKPLCSPWCTTLVHWDSYMDKNLIIRDFHDAGIKWVIKSESGGIKFVPVETYAAEMMAFNRSPEKIFYDYGMPSELTEIRHRQ